MATRRRMMKAATQGLDEVVQTEYAPPGTEITVTWGEETFSPVQYNSFRVGGHSIKVVVQEGETAHEAFVRGWTILEQAAQVQFNDKLSGFADRIKKTKGR